MSCRGSDAPAPDEACCWFCKKGRHSECMIEMPAAGRVHDRDGGPHDCTFDTVMKKCSCTHRDGGGAAP